MDIKPCGETNDIFHIGSEAAGTNITRATIDGWMMRVGELLVPVAAVIRSELPRNTYIQASGSLYRTAPKPHSYLLAFRLMLLLSPTSSG